ncbi:hypothetical protein K1719_021714 [Acacia pycnantha]|nr:hypothetical protein K1719_021714 [Acacia pycnantha]
MKSSFKNMATFRIILVGNSCSGSPDSKAHSFYLFKFASSDKLLIRNWKTSLLGDPNHSLSQRRNCEGLNNSSADQGCVCEQMEP